MPVTKSAKRALRKSLRKKALNFKVRQNYKRVVKNARKTGSDIAKAFSTLDRAAKHGVIHRRKAARLKSRLSKLIKPAVKVKAPPVKQTRASSKKSKKKFVRLQKNLGSTTL